MKILVIGGTGPTGIPVVSGLVDHGHDVTILHRGTHERPETPAVVDHLHADPYDEASLVAALEGTTWDVVVAMYGRLRRIAEVTKGRCGHFVSVGGVPAYRGWTDPWQYEPAGLPVPVREDGDLVEDPEIDSKGYRIVRTEQAVFAAHPQAAHFRYPYLYGPYQPVPREWLVVRRILDHRSKMIVADDGLTLHHHAYYRELRRRPSDRHPGRRTFRRDDLQYRRRRGAHGAPDDRAVRRCARCRPRTGSNT